MSDIEQQLLESSALERLLRLGSGPVVHQQSTLTLTQQFEQQVERTPDAIVAVLAEQQISYGLLHAQSNQLAHYLLRQGIILEAPVGVCMERSLDVLIALLGILKAGGIYVPLDPEAPMERLDWIIADVKPAALLTTPSIAARFSLKDALPVLDHWHELMADEPVHTPASEISVENLAYVIYTSGSTGRPKGVMMSHRGISNTLNWQQDTYRLQPQERVLQKMPLTFDPSLKEIFWTLLNGARLVITPPQAHKDSAAILALTAREAVSAQIFVPSLLQVALEESGWDECRDLRLITCGGEALHPDLVERFFARHPARVMNHYGPTEAAVQASFWSCGGEVQDGIVPIGYPINNTQLLVLDTSGDLLPPGVAGELYIGGANLARGYLGQAALTAERFVPHPWSQEPGACLYRTGDRVLAREDGALEFLGRLDEQVKIRGIRIEPGEVEAVLRTHPQVEDVLVLLQRQGVSQHLIAYVISSMRKDEDVAAELRAYARARLPEALVPTFIQRLDAWPLTSNGKLDRSALPQPGPQRLASSEEGEPRTELEQVLVDIWRQVLVQPELGIHDNFFYLGGDSVLSLQILARSRQAGFQFTFKQLFDLPTIAQLAPVVQHVTLEQIQEQIIQRLSPNPAGYTLTDFPLLQITQTHLDRLLAEHHDVVDIYPLTSMQQGMLFHSLYEPEAGVYVEQMSVTYIELDRGHFLQAWRHLVEQHPILRTSFVVQEQDELLQVVHEHVQLPVLSLDWQHLTAEQQDAELSMWLQEDRYRGLDLQQAPLFRFTLIQLNAQTTRVIWTFHHALLDGWSVSMLLQDLRTSYDAYMQGRYPSGEAHRPYRDYLAWLQQQDPEQMEDYWRGYLADLTESTSLKLDRRGEEQAEYKFLQEECTIALEQSNRWQEMARQAQITLNTLIQGAWALVLARYSGKHDVLFGSVVSGRPPTLSGMEHMIGLFINTLPTRVQVSNQLSVLTWLKQLQSQQIEQRAYEHTALSQVQRWSELGAGQSLFDMLFVFENYPEIVLKHSASQLQMEDVQIAMQINYPLLLLVLPEDNLRLRLKYDTQRYSTQTMRRLLGHLQHVLEQIVREPQQRVDQVTLLRRVEREQLLTLGSGPLVRHEPALTLAQQFELQVDHAPDAIAAVLAEQQISYGTLNAQANQLAHYLRRQGVVLETPVAVCMERSLDVLIVLLGILKAGGVYVPLDPEAPVERLGWIVADVKPAVLLTTVPIAARFSSEIQVPLLATWLEELSAEPDHHPDNVISVDNLAYILYTSGSTGRPKGVMMSHRGISNSLNWLQDEYQLQPHERVMQKMSLTFDPSMKEIFWPLLQGARLIIAPPQAHKDSAAILALTAREAVSVQVFVPSLLQVALEEPGWDACRDLRLVTCGGEALHPDLVARFFARRTALLSNNYGPTEAAMQCSYWNCVRDVPEEIIPIGRPLNNLQLLILDTDGALVPTGVPGELYIGGVNLARGYLGQAALTAERFVPHPWSQETGARLYRTGDRVRAREDGALEFMGRLDEQVKIHGIRVELGEVEEMLRTHPLVHDVLVLLQKQGVSQHLIAYVISAAGEEATLEADLRTYAREKLPEALVPTFIQRLDAWPLTRHGKIDRQALPQPDRQQISSAEESTPRTEQERLLVNIWKQVLGRSAIGVRDNFFYLGGDSILSLQIISRARQTGLHFTLKQLFDLPTIAQLAAELQSADEPNYVRSLSDLPLTRLTQADIDHLAHGRELVDVYPLAPTQQGMLFHSLYEPESGVYVEQMGGTYIDLDKSAFLRAWQHLVALHPILRTSFEALDQEEPLQVVQAQIDLPVMNLDWQQLSLEQQKIALAAWLQEDRQRGLDLQQAPLFRFTLIQLSPQMTRVIWTFHHALLDGWSVSMLLQELRTTYDAYVQGDQPAAEVRRPYRDYLAWLQAQDVEQIETYWRGYLADVTGPSLLGIKRRSSEHDERDYLQEEATVDSTRWQQMARQAQITLNTLIQGAWALVLARYSGQRDVLFGSVVAGRPPTLDGMERMLGLFINTVPTRVQLSDELSVLDWLKLLQAQQLEQRSYEYTPLVQVQRWSDVPAGQSLFETLFVFENYPIEIALSGQESQLRIEDIQINMQANYPLVLIVLPGERLQLHLRYDSHQYDPQTIKRLLQHLQQVLEQMVLEPQQCLGQVTLLQRAELEQLLSLGSGPIVQQQLSLTLAQQFEQQVERAPAAIAAVLADQQVSYGLLNVRANQLAHYLLRQGVGLETPVAVCMERSLEVLVALLGILKAGGVYVPLDPEAPIERLDWIITDVKPAVLLTTESISPRFVSGMSLPVLDQWWEVLASESSLNLASKSSVENLAYIIYTSGSTGRPKGVMMSHRGISNTLRWQRDAYQLQPQERILQKMPLTFDPSLKEIFWPLLCGARLVITPPQAHKDSATILALTAREAVSAQIFVPSLLQVALEESGWDECRDLRLITCGGEALHPDLVERFFARHPARVMNHYGPTEAAVQSSFWSCEREVQDGIVPIGYPINNTQLLVLDASGDLLPPGVAGELYIGGANLARGYLGQAALTAERFVPHPWSQDPGARLYRTGDRAFYRGDGALEFLGRLDEQVKIRGIRIEPGEVEAMLRTHSQVQDVLVLLQKQGVSQHLIAYVISSAPEDEDVAEELRAYARERLPEALVPTFIQRLDTWPLTSNGKLDRSALPQPGPQRLSLAGGAPRTAEERILADIWSQVLGQPELGIHDNFFHLGGDSILSLQILARARQAGLQITLKQLFALPTIAQLALEARHGLWEQELDQEQAGEIPLTPIQHWFFERQLPQPSYFNQAELLQVPRRWSPETLEEVLQALQLRHAVLRYRYEQTAAGWRQSLPEREATVPIALEIIDLSGAPKAEQQTLLEQQALQMQASLELQQGPLWRAIFFNLGVDLMPRLLLVVHHLLIDGVSWRVLLEELQTGMQQRAQGLPLTFPPASISFQRWSRLVADATAAQEQNYWIEAARPEVAPLPRDVVTDETMLTTATRRHLDLALTIEETQQLLHEALVPYRSQVQDLLITALLQTLSDWFEPRQVRLDLEGHGREEVSAEPVDLSRTIGWFTSLYPVLFSLPDSQSDPRGWIQTIKEQARAVPNRGIGYGMLRYLSEDTRVVKALQAVTSAQISFNYLGQFDQTFAISEGEEQVLRKAPESSGAEHGPQNSLSHLLTISALVSGEQLKVTWSYSTQVHRRETIEMLGASFLSHLRQLIAHCLTPEAGGYTPSDFPLARLTQAYLDRVVAEQHDVVDIYPLTPMQQGMLFHSLYEPGSGAYVEQTSGTYVNLDQSVFLRAWQHLVDQHPILRTSFVALDQAEPLQVVHKQVQISVESLDWQQLSVEEQRTRLDTWLQSDRERGFDLQQAPLFRFTLIQLTPQTTRVTWTFHHALLDGWSGSMLLQELRATYDAYMQGRHLIEEVRRPYRDYLAWLQAQDAEQMEAYWRSYLADVTEPTVLGIDRYRGEATKHDYQQEKHVISVERSARLQEMARQSQITLNTLIQGAWALVLARYSGQSDVIFGSVVAGRPPTLSGMERMLGLFINTVPTRVHISEELSVSVWLQHLQEQQIEQRTYEYTPLVQAQRWSEIAAGQSLFETLFVFENYPIETAFTEQASQLRIEEVQVKEQANYPLGLLVQPSERVQLDIKFDTQHFTATAIRRLLQHLQQVLEQIAQEPRQRVGQVTLLSSSEREQLLIQGRGPVVHEQATLTLAQQFERQVECSPDAIAAVLADQQISYGGLNARANQLAHYLLRQGVGLETPVGVCMERSLEVLIALLGILKAGGVYVPLDPEAPADRLDWIIADVQPVVLLTTASLTSRFSLETQVPLLTIWSEALLDESSFTPGCVVSVDNLAYVIYTSGSTGRPKGVMVSHRSISNSLNWLQDEYQLQAHERVMQKMSLTFDPSMKEIFWPLLQGARLIIAPPQAHKDSAAILALTAREAVSVQVFVPSLLQVALEEPGWDACRDLRLVTCGGEALHPDLVARFFSRRTALLSNNYGPTEAAMQCSYWNCARDVPEEIIPIGRPLINVQLLILDADGALVPIGVPGELYIGGVNLARGYLGQAALTAERFVPHPWSQEPGARLYRTGDRVCRREDGALEFMGRLDEQVKIRGIRIEPGEVEAVLRAHPLVHDVLVVLQKQGASQHLVAYVISTAGEEENLEEELRVYAREHLPEALVPAFIQRLDAWPLTRHGKIDRRALPQPGPRQLSSTTGGEPQTEEERILVDIWSQVLGQPAIGIHDNFFHLGGDSILSLQILARARQAGLQITLKQLFSLPTIAQLALEARHGLWEQELDQELAGKIPLTPIQHWFFEQQLAQPSYFNQAELLQVPRGWYPEGLEEVLQAVQLRHAVLRYRYEQTSAGWRQSLPEREATVPIKVEMIDLSAATQAEQRSLLEQQALQVQASLNLQEGPLWRAVFFTLGDGQPARLLLVAHHLIIDSVSWRILLEELQAGMQQRAQGLPLTFPPASTSFQRWTQILSAAASSQDQSYWIAAARPEVTPLPRDIVVDESTLTSATRRHLDLALTTEETQQLLHDVLIPYRSQVQDLLITALLQTLSAWFGPRQVRLDLEGHGREEVSAEPMDLSRTVGWFTNLYPVLFSLPDAHSDPGRWIQSIKEQVRAVPNRGIGYGILRYLSDDPTVREALQKVPAVQISLNYLGQFDQTFASSEDEKQVLRRAPESSGAEHGPQNKPPHLLGLNALVIGEKLRVSWSYNTRAHHVETIEMLGASFLTHLRQLITHCLTPEAGGYTPSDFPLVRLTQAQLDRIVADQRDLVDLYPLTPIQQDMFLHARSHPESGAYIEQMSVAYVELNQSAFLRSWQHLVDQHPILHTSFVTLDQSEALQIVHKQARLAVESLDWQHLSTEQQRTALNGWLQEDRAHGIDLQQVPLFRLTVIKLSQRTTRVIWTFHHVLLDGWGVSMLLRELRTTYDAYVQGHQPVEEVRRPYRDYLAWLQQQDPAQVEAYWREYLADISEPTALGIGRQRLEQPEHDDYAQEERIIALERSTNWREMARESQITLNTLIQGAWALLLVRYGGQSDVLFGSVVSGRPATLNGMENMLGMFTNSVPTRIQVPDELSVLDWLKEIQEQQIEQRVYEYIPASQAQRWSDLPPGQPLFETLLHFKNHPDLILQEIGSQLQIEEVQVKEQANYPLGLLVQPGENLRLLMKYDTHRFSAVVIQRLLLHFQQALEQMVSAPQKRVDQILLLTSAEHQQLLALSSGPVTPQQPSLTLAQQFEQQVDRAPDAIAAVLADQQISYGELNSRANQLAHYLLRQGVSSETPVAICLERSLDVLVALLGILKAGGIYVPLDPETPVERLSWIIADVKPVVLLTSVSLATHFVLKHEVPVLDQWWEASADESDRNPDRIDAAEQLAYIIYTSGSTGRPKGVMMSHGGITNSLRWIQQEYPLTAQDRVLQKAALTFDPSIEEIFWPLLNGARLVLTRPGEHRDSLSVLALTAREAVSVQIFIPSLLQVALEESGWEACRDLRLVLCGGEILRPDLVERFFARHLAQVTNLYGPTEAAVQCSFWPCSRAIQEEIIPIGYPINNTQLLVLDAHGELVPQGVAGELYIGGSNLARGYLGQAALTAERFVPHPWSQEPGARLYRTGDRALYREDGALEFLGRLDEQVKIRGVRIEPGEVEAVLRTHPLVQDVLVLLQKQGVSQHLVAYVILTEDKELKLAEVLRTYVRDRLPEALVPTFVQFLDTWPLTRHGKIDRQALPQPGPQQLSSSEEGQPRTDVERLLVEVWVQVLGQPGIGIHDNFFHLGGDSILSAQILARARQAGFQFTLKQLFDLPTVAQLALEAHHVELTHVSNSYSLKIQDGKYSLLSFPLAQLTQEQLDQLLSEQPDLVDVYPLTSAQQRMFSRSLAAPGSGIFVEQMSLTYADLDQPTFLQAWRHLVAQHPILRTSFMELEHGEALQIVHEQVQVPVVSLDWQHLSSDQQHSELDVWLLADRQRGLDLQHAPLLRFTLMQLTSHLTCVIWTYHHLLLDGWSVSLLQQELRAAYDAYMQGRQPAEEVHRPYRDYLAWLQEQDLPKMEAYWRSYLADVTEPIQLGIDHRRGEQAKQIYQQEEYIIAPEFTSRWQKMTRQSQITLNTLLQGAWSLLLARYSERHDIIFGSIVSGRPPTLDGMERMLGLFINTLPIRIQVSDELSVLDWLRQIQEQQLEQRAYEYASLMQIQGWSAITEGQPLFETVLNFENYPEIVLQQDGSQLKIEDVQIKGQASYLLFLRIVPGESLHLHLRYNAQRISAEAAQRLLRHLQQTMEQMAQQPQQRVREVTLLSGDERERMLTAARGPAVSQQPYRPLAQQFEQQVERTPDAVAVALTEQQISYGMLNARANQLAHYLRRQGVDTETPVGVGLERSLDLLVALLGILKAGGVYVPLDPEAPVERLDWIIADVKPLLLLTSASLSRHFPSNVPTLLLDRWSESIADEPVENLASVVSVENLAYVIYTSGSTGRPKGVMMSHRGISNSLNWLQDEYQLQPQERLLQKTALTFDPSLKEIFWPLLNGARLVVAPPQAHKDSAAILALTAREAVSTQIFIPSLFQVALDEAGWEECRALRLVMCGGEALQSALLERFFTRHHAQVTNLYGPTEAAVQCSFWNYDSETQEGILPIGSPINNTQLLVLDPRGELVPQGIAGELYIGGANLARGYLRQAALTAERFVPDPWSQEPGARLYRTGDRVLVRADGKLEFLGRLDEQVKIRGVRIEPGEVESVLRTHPLVQDVLVLLQKQDDIRHLVAYVISTASAELKLEETLRAYARERVPEALVPTFIQRLNAWPLTRNGKLDRAALPLPSLQREVLSDEEKPLTELEQVLMGIWEQILGRSEISIYDNFFELGGYSLLAMQLMNQVEQQLEQSLTLADLIEAPTIEQMAQLLQSQLEPQSQRLRSPIVPLNAGGTKQPFFCVHPVSGDLLSYLGLTQYLDQNQPVYGIQATRLDEGQQHVPSRSIEQIATIYVNALLEFQPTGPYALGGHSFGGLVAFEMAQQLQAQGRKVNTLLLIDSHWGRKAHGEGYDRTEAQWIAGLATILASYQGKATPFSLQEIESLSSEAQLIALRDHLAASEIVPAEMKLAGLRELLQTIKANIRSQLTYQPKIYQGKVTLIRCKQSEFDDLTAKWAPLSSEPLEEYVVPGDHFSMLTEAYVPSLANLIQRILDA